MNIQKMDEQLIELLDFLAENELSLGENIAIVTKALGILLKLEEEKAKTEEEKEIMQKARQKIAQYIINGDAE